MIYNEPSTLSSKETTNQGSLVDPNSFQSEHILDLDLLRDFFLSNFDNTSEDGDYEPSFDVSSESIDGIPRHQRKVLIKITIEQEACSW